MGKNGPCKFHRPPGNTQGECVNQAGNLSCSIDTAKFKSCKPIGNYHIFISMDII